MNCEHHAHAYADFFERLRPDTPAADYARYFEADIYFEDPFHRLKGLKALTALFDRMFDTMQTPKFVVDEVICADGIAYLRWEFSYRRSSVGPVEHIEGVSRVQFSASGKVSSHIDYWDAARNVYERLPLVGKAVAFLRNRIAAA